MNDTHQLFAPTALMQNGWAENVLLRWDGAGTLIEVTANSTQAESHRAAGPLLPGMPNVHSHAFQRAMAGLTEYVGDPRDSFWSWRKLMYQFARKLRAEDLEIIARQVYIEMLKGGYTSVCEFHYLHHTPDGKPYADRAELSRRIIASAEVAGIGLTLLPSLYRHGNFGGQPPLPGQGRFLNQVDEFMELVKTLSSISKGPALKIGVAPHSLRAVSPKDLAKLLGELDSILPGAPIHMHIAEQIKEVADCVVCTGARPVEWLLKELPVNGHWCLIHAIHLNDWEIDHLAASKAVTGACPSTEGNLGDGIFRATRYFSAGGRLGIGSDSNVCTVVAEELRLLECGQRLQEQCRNRLATLSKPAVADEIYLGMVKGGAQASGRNIAGLAVGQQADFVILDETHPDLAPLPAFHRLAGLIFCNHGGISPIRDVFVKGEQVIRNGHHAREEAAAADYCMMLKHLMNQQ